VAESQEILAGNRDAAAILADLRGPQAILDHPAVRRLLDFSQPVGLLLAAVLHFVPDDAQAYAVVDHLVGALPPGSYLVASHTATETFAPISERATGQEDVYRRRTATPGTVRTRDEVGRFFTGLTLLDPGVVRADLWRPDPGDQPPDPGARPDGGIWAAVGRKD
jgi:hypothetical protein